MLVKQQAKEVKAPDSIFDIKNATIVKAMLKAQDILFRHDKVMASVSGGSDSDIMLDMLERCKREGQEIHYVWFDTGVEYQATKDHLVYLEQKYNITIERFKAEKPIPLCVKQYGVPFLSKYVSSQLEQLQRHNFQWEDGTFEELVEKYPRCKSALRWWTNAASCNIKSYNIKYYSFLKEFLMENPPDFKISDKCCYYAKKLTGKKARDSAVCDLDVIGVRKAEGGIRATAFSSCYTQGIGVDHFRPIFWFTDEDKRDYENLFGVVHSACYTRYGLRRTGCVGCPFGLHILRELSIIEGFEPRLYGAVMNVFGKSYEYKKAYYSYRALKKLERTRDRSQLTFDIQ